MSRSAASSKPRFRISSRIHSSASPACPRPTAARRLWKSTFSQKPCAALAKGHRQWDLMPNSTMTNATVAQMVKDVEGDEITLKYKDGEKKIVVVPNTTIVTYVPADKSELKLG